MLELSVGALFNNPAKRRLDYMEKVSAIVAIYKSEKFLPKLIDSIINQTWQNLEILLVDDGSPDNSGAICDNYASRDDRIRVIHKKNGGACEARNVGLAEAITAFQQRCTGEMTMTFIVFFQPEHFLGLSFKR